MAKLDTTVGNIQRVSNMIKHDDTTTPWDDNTYPSALAVLEKIDGTIPDKFEHPVGSIVITSNYYAETDSKHPNNTLGGKWVLIDKSFKYGITDIGPPLSFSQSPSGISISGETAIRTDHSLLIKLGVASANDITISTSQSSVLLVSLDLPRLGVNQLSSASTRGIAFASSTNASAAGAVIYYNIQKDGKVYLNDVVNGGSSTLTLKKNMYMYINAIIPMNYTDMMDEFCDKFYWKRES